MTLLYHILVLNAYKKCLKMIIMSDIKEQIFQELDSVESLALHLRADANCASKQTDLEVAILTKQVKTLREKNEKAKDLIEKSVSILEKLKK